MKKIFSILLFLLPVCIVAQTQSAELDYNNTRITILNGGDFFWDLSSAKYEVPKVESSALKRHSIFSGAVWIGAEDDEGKIHLAAMTYRQRGQDFWPGPTTTDPNRTDYYDQIYTISAQEIDDHKENPANPPTSIRQWPGNGDTTKGEPYQLAPFIDINKNGKYEPFMGDYPKIKGLKAAYCVYNDNGGEHTESGGEPLNIEVHQLFYQDVFYYGNQLIDDVNFASFTIVNRSNTTYSNLRFGLFIDYDIGNFTDDYVGSDVPLNMTFAYNGDDYDEGDLGYRFSPPAQGTMFLNKSLHSAVYFNNNDDPINGSPTQASDFYNFLNAKWKNGANIKYGSDGITNTDGTVARYVFPFDSDSSHDEHWSEGNWRGSSNTPSDRRMIGIASPITLYPGESACYDIAFIFGRTTSENAEESIGVMKEKAQIVQAIYNNNSLNWKDSDCIVGAQQDHTSSTYNLRNNNHEFSVYPNPSTGLFTIQDFEKLGDFKIINSIGEEVIDYKLTNNILDLSNLSSGVYFLQSEVGSLRLLKL